MSNRSRDVLAVVVSVLLIAAYAVWAVWAEQRINERAARLAREAAEQCTASQIERQIERQIDTYELMLEQYDAFTNIDSEYLMHCLRDALAELAGHPHLTDEQKQRVSDLMRQIDDRLAAWEQEDVSPTDLAEEGA